MTLYNNVLYRKLRKIKGYTVFS